MAVAEPVSIAADEQALMTLSFDEVAQCAAQLAADVEVLEAERVLIDHEVRIRREWLATCERVAFAKIGTDL